MAAIVSKESLPCIQHIGLFVESLTEGGAERMMVTLANVLAGWGYTIDLLVVRDSGSYRDILSKDVRKITLFNSMNSSNIFFRLKRKFFLYFNLWRYFRREVPDVFMVTMRRDNLIVSRIYTLSLKRFPLILREADSIFNENNKTIDQMRYWYKRARYIVANSESTKKDLAEKILLNPEKIVRIYNPMSIPQARIRVKNQHIRILGCGRLVAKKNFSDLIKVMPLIRNIYSSAELTIIGEGEERPGLEALIKQMNLEEAVSLSGLVFNPNDYYSGADVFVQTSLYEGFGYVLAEAMACGTPVVAYDSHGAMREILDNGKYGILVPPEDIDALKNAVISQLENPTPPNLLAEAVRRFDKDIIGKEYLELFKKAFTES